MRVLIDECIDHRYRLSFPEHDCWSVRFAGFGSFKNGMLLREAEAAGFDVLLTSDTNMGKQQNMSGRQIAIVVLRAPSNRLADLLPLVEGAKAAMASMKPGEIVEVG